MSYLKMWAEHAVDWFPRFPRGALIGMLILLGATITVVSRCCSRSIRLLCVTASMSKKKGNVQFRPEGPFPLLGRISWTSLKCGIVWGYQTSFGHEKELCLNFHIKYHHSGMYYVWQQVYMEQVASTLLLICIHCTALCLWINCKPALSTSRDLVEWK